MASEHTLECLENMSFFFNEKQTTDCFAYVYIGNYVSNLINVRTTA